MRGTREVISGPVKSLPIPGTAGLNDAGPEPPGVDPTEHSGPGAVCDSSQGGNAAIGSGRESSAVALPRGRSSEWSGITASRTDWEW
jgi:hypothetical protein